MYMDLNNFAHIFFLGKLSSPILFKSYYRKDRVCINSFTIRNC